MITISKFYSTFFQETVFENTKLGANILRVQAYNDDRGQNSQLTHEIENPGNVDFPFKINNENRLIPTTRESLSI